ncbi:MAG: hypothetical protein AAF939_03190 [Planctomycetota bacterium]
MTDKTEKTVDGDDENVVVVSSEYFFDCPVCDKALPTKKEHVGKIKICTKCFNIVAIPEENGYSIPYGVVCLDAASFWRNHKKKLFISMPFLILAAVFIVLGIGYLFASGSEAVKAHNRKIAREIEAIEEDINSGRDFSRRTLKEFASELSAFEMAELDTSNEQRIATAKSKVLDLWTAKEAN